MHEFHAWIALTDSAYEADSAVVRGVVDELYTLIADFWVPTASYLIRTFNGAFFFNADGYSNRRRYEAEFLDQLLDVISAKLPGSYGLVYEIDDERVEPPGNNACLPRVMARGRITVREDHYLSPVIPTIAD